MANAHDARRLSKRAFRRRPGLMRTTALIFMLLSTLLVFSPAILTALLPGFTVPSGWPGRLMLAGVCFLCCMTGLLMNGPAVAAARGKEIRVFENFHFPRWIITMILAAVPSALLGCSPVLISLFSKYIDQPLAEYIKSVLPDGFFSLYLALGGLLLIFLGAIVCLSWSVFTRQVMIYLFERKTRLKGAHFLQMMRSGLLNAFSPIRIFFSSLLWFVLMGVLGCLSVLAVRFISVGWQEGISIADQLLSLINSFHEIPIWLAMACFSLSYIWIGGLGFIFWPRYQLKRVYYQRMLMNENGMDVNDAQTAGQTE